MPQKKGESSKPKSDLKAAVSSETLPTELDFFKYAEGGQGKRKAPSQHEKGKSKRMRVDGEQSEEDLDEDQGEREGSVEKSQKLHQTHRVVMKGLNPPKVASSFEEIKDRYNIPSHLYANLAKNDYIHPTGIQSSGIPALLEVRTAWFMFERSPNIRSAVERPRCYFADRYWKDLVVPLPNLCQARKSRVDPTSPGVWLRAWRACRDHLSDTRTCPSNPQRMPQTCSRSEMAGGLVQQSNCKYAR